ncbi:PLP-dependent aminotransferase family protein [Streptococcus sp. NSJ-72]|uniref:MocR-like pyridoxine biosynthesis transcription factor PdxR n=1 Tax=Streptococcus sp. NSJ-72 TaxID=2763068 RepID=UPI0016516E30|nr:PLP-dependent aminotransferase family protein [Streptococcus sp. NSJ-72]QNL41475.1 PLP-dependent aminotransferase family protein [Streptococcus sp. NSJ-72]
MINLKKGEGQRPLYEQIYNQIKLDIINGYLSPNERILGARTLAKMLEVSRNTVDRAYLQLTLEGYIESRKNSGFYVLKLPKMLHSGKEKCTFDESYKDEEILTQEDVVYDLTNSSHTSNLFPKKVWKKHYLTAIDQLELSEKLSSLQPFQGDVALRKEICRYLKRIRGVVCHPRQIIITSGLQQSLDYLCQFLGKSKNVLMEEPSYPKAREIFRKNSCNISTEKVDDKGLYIGDLSNTSKIDMIYTTPSHQFPLGMIMPISRRQKLLEFAEQNDSFVIEDDYDSELRYYEKPVPALKSIDYPDRVIYLGTFSKILSPSFRMSYIVLPEQFTEGFLERFKLHNSTVNLINQIALANVLSSGDYDRLVRKMNHIFKKRYEAFQDGFDSFQIPIKVSHNVSGQYFLVNFPTKINQSEVIKRALDEGVKVYDTMQFWQDEAECPHEHLFLGFSKIELEDIPDCMKRLKKAWDI